ncbi:MFS domain-containing protein [Physcia stellaris]|nr:MFS domain-containing protein [Physcia stellaris]
MVGSTLAAVASRHDSITPTLSQTRSHASENRYGSKVDRRSPKDVENADSEEKARIDRLGRERPAKFKSIWAEVAFCYSIIASMIMAEYFVSGFNVILPILIVKLDIPQASQVWPASAFSLVTAAFLLPFGRLGDMYGGYSIYLGGLTWFCVWSLIAGFSQNQLMLVFARALQGLGPAAFLPSGVMLLGSIYRPGPRKNLVFSLYGGAAPLGFFAGVFFAGMTGQYLTFGWYFWIGAILIFTTILAAIWAVPNDYEERRGMGVEMDWMGSFLIVAGLVLVVFAITDSSHAPSGWATPYIYVTLIVGALLLVSAVYVEGYIATAPLLPPSLFKVPYLKPLILALLLSYGVLGVFLLYGTLYMQDIMGGTPLQIVAWFTPMCLGGCIIAITGGYVLHLLSGTMLMVVSGLGWILTSLLFALAPPGANYWAFIFPAMIGATIGIDVTYNVTNVFITTSLPQRQQGLAGALINSLVFLGIAFILSFADVTQTETAYLGLRRSYQSVFWYQLAVSATALAIMLVFVRIRKAESDLTVDEKAALEAEKEKS